MNITTTRLLNYKALMIRFRDRKDQEGLPAHGMLKRFAEEVCISPRYLTHINSGFKNIGHKTARQLEKGSGEDEGWLDVDHMPRAAIRSVESDAKADFLAMASELFEQSPVEVQALMIRYLIDRSKRQP